MMNPQEASQQTRRLCEMAPVIPVLTIHNIENAIPLAKALIAGGLPVLEITLRTPIALAAISAMASVQGGFVGVGTLLSAEDIRAAKSAGAMFGVSPGATNLLLDAAEAADLPILPGAATASEAMALLERGYDMLKFFPAEASGGTSALKSIGAPLPQITFCPTGGVSPDNVNAYISLENVLCVGGSWVAPEHLISSGAWGEIEKLARTASQLKA